MNAVKKLSVQAPIIAKRIVDVSKPKLLTFRKYAEVELTPPKLSDVQQIRHGLADLIRAAKTGRWKQLTVKEAWLNTLVASEIVFIFFIGECIGKRGIIGYDV